MSTDDGGFRLAFCALHILQAVLGRPVAVDMAGDSATRRVDQVQVRSGVLTGHG